MNGTSQANPSPNSEATAEAVNAHVQTTEAPLSPTATARSRKPLRMVRLFYWLQIIIFILSLFFAVFAFWDNRMYITGLGDSYIESFVSEMVFFTIFFIYGPTCLVLLVLSVCSYRGLKRLKSPAPDYSKQARTIRNITIPYLIVLAIRVFSLLGSIVSLFSEYGFNFINDINSGSAGDDTNSLVASVVLFCLSVLLTGAVCLLSWLAWRSARKLAAESPSAETSKSSTPEAPPSLCLFSPNGIDYCAIHGKISVAPLPCTSTIDASAFFRFCYVLIWTGLY